MLVLEMVLLDRRMLSFHGYHVFIMEEETSLIHYGINFLLLELEMELYEILFMFLVFLMCYYF